jgi:hypothetical protein
VFACVAWSPNLWAQSDDDFKTRCAAWLAKRGYSRDYIEERTGVRPPPRGRWHDNIRLSELRPGDVVVLKVWPGHLAFVEEIERDGAGNVAKLKVSDFNYGPGQPWLDRSCEVTSQFGKVSTRWVAVEETSGYWRAPGSR